MLPVERAEMNETLLMGTDEVTVLAPSADTDGDLFAVQIRMQPGGGPPVMHRHAPSEVYHLLSGELTFYVTGPDGTARRTASAGDTVALAGGTTHTIRNESDSEAVAFCVHTPGGPMEGFVRAAAALATPTMENVLSVAAEHGIEMLGPVTPRPA
jgi:mannose-6-phosphate isomerase-like protein (cupin superfamily)